MNRRPSLPHVAGPLCVLTGELRSPVRITASHLSDLHFVLLLDISQGIT